MALEANSLYPQSAKARELAGQIGSGSVTLQITIDTAINTAIGAGLFTTTASVAGASAQNIQAEMYVLKQMGFTATVSGTTLTVSW